MELRDYWNIVLRHWKLVGACVVAGLAIASVLTVRASPTYSSSARVLFATTPTNTSSAYKGSLLVTQQIGNYASLVNGSRLASEVSKSLGGTPGAGALQGEIKAVVTPGTAIVQVTATSAHPATAQKVAQAYAQGLSQLVTELQGARGGVIDASVVDAANLPTTALSPKPVINLLAGLIGGLVIGLGLTVLRELMDNSVAAETDMARITDAPVLAGIPRDNESARRPADLAEDTAWQEGFRVLRTSLRFADVAGPHRVYVVTAARKGEGATTTAAGLAASLAAAQQRVALVECDLRYPVLARRLDLDPAVGLSTVLSGKASLADAVQEVPGTGLRVLPCGPVPPHPTELLQSTAMAEVLAQLREEHDVVVLDAPPVLPVADAAGLAALADGTLIVVRHRQTDQDELARAAERLGAVGARVVGLVVNLARLDRSTRDYGAGSRASSEA